MRKRARWTAEEISVLQSLYSTSKMSVMVELLPQRNATQIQQKATSLSIFRLKKEPRTPEQVREAKRLQMAKRYKEDPDRARKYNRDRHYKNRDKNLKTMREYYTKRFFWGRSMKLRGDARANFKQLAALWKSQSGRCALTGKRLERSAQLDHRLPKALGGNDSLSNLQWVSAEVNYAKRDLTEDAFLELCESVITWRSGKVTSGEPRVA